MLEPGGEGAFGRQRLLLRQGGPFAFEELLLGPLHGGEVLEEAVDLDRGAVGVRLGLRDDPQVPDLSPGGGDAEGVVDGPPVPEEALHLAAQGGQVLVQDVLGQLLQGIGPREGRGRRCRRPVPTR